MPSCLFSRLACAGHRTGARWQSWTYTPAGTRLTQTDHDVTGNSANDTVTTDNYPAQGSATDQPHTLTRP